MTAKLWHSSVHSAHLPSNSHCFHRVIATQKHQSLCRFKIARQLAACRQRGPASADAFISLFAKHELDQITNPLAGKIQQPECWPCAERTDTTWLQDVSQTPRLEGDLSQLPVFSNGLSQDDIAHPWEGKSSVSSGARLCCRSEPAELSIVTHRWHIVVEAPRDMHECSECLLFLAASLRRVEG